VSIHAFRFNASKSCFLPLRDNLFNVMKRHFYNDAFCLFDVLVSVIILRLNVVVSLLNKCHVLCARFKWMYSGTNTASQKLKN